MSWEGPMKPSEEDVDVCRLMREFRAQHQLSIMDMSRLLGVSRRCMQYWLHDPPRYTVRPRHVERFRRVYEAYQNLDMRDRVEPPRLCDPPSTERRGRPKKLFHCKHCGKDFLGGKKFKDHKTFVRARAKRTERENLDRLRKQEQDGGELKPCQQMSSEFFKL